MPVRSLSYSLLFCLSYTIGTNTIELKHLHTHPSVGTRLSPHKLEGAKEAEPFLAH